MSFTRRSLFALLARAGLALGLGPLGARAAVQAAGADNGRALTAFLHALIPDDDLGPGAVALGIDARLAAKAAADRGYRLLLDLGCRSLDALARELGAPDFADLSDDGRDRVLALAAEASPGSAPRVFFDTIRQDALSHYYAEPAAWAAIGYAGPPQPAGFPDHASPPGRHG